MSKGNYCIFDKVIIKLNIEFINIWFITTIVCEYKNSATFVIKLLEITDIYIIK